MTCTSPCIPKDELREYARSDNPALPRFGRVSLHLWAGCEACTAWMAAYRRSHELRAPPPRASSPLAWIRPRRFLVRGAHVRAGALADVSLLCGVGPYELDVLVRELAGPRSLAIAGQVTQAERIHEPVPELPLALLEAASCGVVMATNTNEFGEFVFDETEERAFGLRCGEGSDAPVVLVWDGSI